MNNIIVKKPFDCSEDELNKFQELIDKGKEVNPAGLSDRIRNAKHLIFLYDDDTLAGVAAVKQPNPSYRAGVFSKANSSENPEDFPFEAGWMFIEEDFRGQHLSRVLLQKILEIAGNEKIYATTREGNEAMKRTNARFGLKQSGDPYQSIEGDYNLVLYTLQTD